MKRSIRSWYQVWRASGTESGGVTRPAVNSEGRLGRLLAALGFLLALPMALSPTHPIAVYAYLADLYDSPLTPKALAYSDADLECFLTSPQQVERYRADLYDDAMDTYTGRLFAIARGADGSLHQEPIRTWNGLVPHVLPAFLSAWLDRKELPFLGDEVEVWLRGNEIVAMGHYHPFGGSPSPGDSAAQYLSHLPEVVIVNGLVPMVYLNEEVLVYGNDVTVSEQVFRSIRSLQCSLLFDIAQNAMLERVPTRGLKSYLGYLRDYRGVDIGDTREIARETLLLCDEFEDSFAGVFATGFDMMDVLSYRDDPDKCNVIMKLQTVRFWSRFGWASISNGDVSRANVSPSREHASAVAPASLLAF